MAEQQETTVKITVEKKVSDDIHHIKKHCATSQDKCMAWWEFEKNHGKYNKNEQQE